MLQAVEREFRLDISDAVDILETSKFDRQDIMGDASIHSFAYKIFGAAKACGGTSNEYLLMRLYLALDPDLQVFVNSPTSTDTLSEYVKMIEEKRKAFRRKEGTENAQKVHLVGGNSYPQEGGSYDEPLHSTDNTLHTTEKSNWRSQQHVNKRNDFDPNNWPYERHEQYYQNGRYFPRRNAPRFQRMVPHSYNHDRRRDVGENLIGQQQERNRGGGYGYYDHEFDTNNLEAYWNPHVSGHRIDEQAPYGFNPQRMEAPLTKSIRYIVKHIRADHENLDKETANGNTKGARTKRIKGKAKSFGKGKSSHADHLSQRSVLAGVRNGVVRCCSKHIVTANSEVYLPSWPPPRGWPSSQWRMTASKHDTNPTALAAYCSRATGEVSVNAASNFTIPTIVKYFAANFAI
ncbi:hypothetical protein FoTM2_010802 [Fusarium oxysporum f. sp. vasinfectum]|nr:hypothetical protein FoTM2_010802 [Fusarium oxysporum f. sp. vasinfectum]